MGSVKDAAREVVDRLSDEATWDDLMYELYEKQKIESGLADVAAGRTIPQAALQAMFVG